MASTAQGISRGNLSQQVEVKGEDELGTLAKAFNSMTNQLRSFIDGLEKRVEERTAEIKALQTELLKKERLAVLGRLTATIAHEIRNPLGTVNTSIFSIRTGMERDNQKMIKRALTLAERNIKRCDNIITELLDYTRKIDIRKELVDLDLWLNEIIDEQPNPSATLIHKNFACGIPVPIDREYLRRAVINILVNAIQAIDEDDASGNELFVGTGVEGQMVEIRITDTGPGIPEDLHDKIFEPLFSTKGFGVGLGLTIVKDIIEKHNGNMEITSQPGKGATVILRIPAFNN
jgi:signal transduction histidine kinase